MGPLIKKVLCAFFLCFPLRAFLQPKPSCVDSIHQYLLTDKPDTGKSYLLLRVAQLPEYPADSLLLYGRQWYAYTVQQHITAGLPEALYVMGLGWYRKGRKKEAISCLYKAATTWEATGSNPLQLARTYELIAGIYKTLGRFSDALAYYRQSFSLKKKLNQELVLLSTYNGLGMTFRLLERNDSAIFYLKKSFRLAAGNELAMAQVSNNLGNIYWSLKHFTLAVEWYTRALQHFKIVNNAAGIAETCFNLGAVATQRKQYQHAINYYNQSLQEASAGQPLEHLEWIYRHLADAYYKTGRLKEAYVNVVKYVAIKDSSSSLNMQRSIADLKEKYETEKKENALALEQARLAKLSITYNNQVRLIYILIAVTGLIVAAAYLLFRNIRRKQMLTVELAALKEKEKQQLIQEQSLKNSLAMLEGREIERQRISRDLHDRVGGTLSSINLFVQSIKCDIPAMSNTTFKIERLLNEVIDDVRRISHDLSNRIVQQYGLQAALEDLKDTAKATGVLDVALHQQVVEPLPALLEAEIYYVCRELVTNAIKHSKASQLSIQLLKEHPLLYLTVEDNGIGFDPALVRPGIGLANIRTRADKIHAQFDIDSQPGKGVCVSLIIPIEPIT